MTFSNFLPLIVAFLAAFFALLQYRANLLSVNRFKWIELFQKEKNEFSEIVEDLLVYSAIEDNSIRLLTNRIDELKYFQQKLSSEKERLASYFKGEDYSNLFIELNRATIASYISDHIASAENNINIIQKIRNKFNTLRSYLNSSDYLQNQLITSLVNTEIKLIGIKIYEGLEVTKKEIKNFFVEYDKFDLLFSDVINVEMSKAKTTILSELFTFRWRYKIDKSKLKSKDLFQ